MMTSLYSEQIPVTEITSDWYKFHFPRDSRVITCVNLNLDEQRGITRIVFVSVSWVRITETVRNTERPKHPKQSPKKI